MTPSRHVRPILVAACLLAWGLGAAANGGEQNRSPVQAPEVSASAPEASQAPEGGAQAGRSGGGQGGQGAHRKPAPLSGKLLEEAVTLVIEIDPTMAPRIERLRSERPEMLPQVLQRRFPRLRHLLKLKKMRPEIYAMRIHDIRLEKRSREQVRALAALPEGDPGVDAARVALRATLDRHFQVRQDVRRLELAVFRERLAQMEAKLSADESRRDELVSKRLAKLEAEPEGGNKGASRRDADKAVKP